MGHAYGIQYWQFLMRLNLLKMVMYRAYVLMKSNWEHGWPDLEYSGAYIPKDQELLCQNRNKELGTM